MTSLDTPAYGRDEAHLLNWMKGESGMYTAPRVIASLDATVVLSEAIGTFDGSCAPGDCVDP